MLNTITEVVETVKHLSASEQREVLARLWTEQAQRATGEVWQTVRFSEKMRVVAYAPEQENYLAALKLALQTGVLARLENAVDGSYEIYGADRTYYVTMTLAREFAGLLSSWPPEHPPHELHLAGDE